MHGARVTVGERITGGDESPGYGEALREESNSYEVVGRIEEG